MKIQIILKSAIYCLSAGILIGCGTSRQSSYMQGMVAKLEIKEPIEGVCNNDAVYAILPITGNGQIDAKAALTDAQIQEKLNNITFLKEHKSHSDKGMVGLIINCKGEMVQCKIDNKTSDPALDAQIVAVFSELKKWEPATMNGNTVDCSVLYSFEIKNSIITIK